ncbi:DUF3180 domain-containing protein [Corynebacterium liangguodongii]|uniref:DUF3180 domain-containing protein n=1 Tax=Corynebacterium liangguodongii TaxID=2079535 RepID=A0A2S0WFW5_9CORY|nr:DUF3180 domain-containing protein [Corynebacterium liangguodongii]AWB84661.1 DUF3180 domain-containing protein [Corynebacterium liangguodongii]PWB99669.1 DUF3180 domain-containing protein [Corynebacterium liangguodongii]
MSETPIPGLVAAAGFMAAAGLILCRRFYGAVDIDGALVSMPLWVVAALCFYAAYMVRRRRHEGKIGLDRSQLNPMMAANFMLLGKACAWVGAVCGGAFAGVAVYIAPQAGELAAAEADLPGTLSGLFGGAALAVAGVVLERSCEVSPPTEGEAAR